MNREVFFDQALESRVEAVIRLNHKSISREGIATCLELGEQERQSLPDILEDLQEQGVIRTAKRGYVPVEPLPALAVARVSGIKEQGNRNRYDSVQLAFENDPDVPFELKISKSNAQKHKLMNGEVILVSLTRNAGSSLSAKFMDRYRREKDPVVPVKFTREALKKGGVAEVIDDRAKGMFIPVANMPSDPKKHTDWNARLPKTTSLFSTVVDLTDERFEHNTGNRIVDVLASKHALSPRVTGEVKDESRKAARRKLNLEGYRDLTSLNALVIDPPNPFDRDDGIHVKFDPHTGGFRTFVMNADVCARVPPTSMMFGAALERGPTHFFPHDGKAFHMLHKDLVRATSLHEGALKPVDYIETVWDEDLNPIEEHHGLGVIEAHSALSYGQMEDRLMVGQDQDYAYREFFERAISQKREQEGLLLFNGEQDYTTPASVFLVAYMMTYANEARALHAIENDLPFIFRTHGFCTSELAFAGLHHELSEMGYDLPRSYLDMDDTLLSDILMEASMRREADVVEMMIRRRLLQRAKYEAEPGYHFAMKRDQFAHTTSPVRRPSDLYNQAARHRVLHPDGVKSLTALTDELAMMDQEVAELCNRHELVDEAVASDYKHFHDFRRLSRLIGSTVRCEVFSSSPDELEIIYPSMGIRKAIPKEELPRNFLGTSGTINPLPEGQRIYVKVENVRPQDIDWDVSVVKTAPYQKPKSNPDMPEMVA